MYDNIRQDNMDNCVTRTCLDVLLWTCQLSDKERICISEDDDSYLQDDSSIIDRQACAGVGLLELSLCAFSQIGQYVLLFWFGFKGMHLIL